MSVFGVIDYVNEHAVLLLAVVVERTASGADLPGATHRWDGGTDVCSTAGFIRLCHEATSMPRRRSDSPGGRADLYAAPDVGGCGGARNRGFHGWKRG
jgi:hypothetical protein